VSGGEDRSNLDGVGSGEALDEIREKIVPVVGEIGLGNQNESIGKLSSDVAGGTEHQCQEVLLDD